MKRQKGITLIALVITIIVLLILAGVSISMALGENGILTRAENAVEQHREGEQDEQAKLQNAVEYMDKYGTEGDGTVTDLKPGDYIKYDTGKENIGDNGILLCRVLYNDSTNGLQIVTDKNITQKVDGVDVKIEITLGGDDWETGKAAYNSGIETLNNEAEKYLNSNNEYIIDARCVGSLPAVNENGVFTEKDKGTESNIKVSSDWTLPEGWLTDDTGCFDVDTNYLADQEIMIEKGIWAIGETYWLGSRGSDGRMGYKFIGISSVTESGYVNSEAAFCMLGSNGSISGNTFTNGFRPCFSLDSDIKITGGDGKSEATAYTF